MVTVNEALRFGALQLKDESSGTPRLDAEVILAHILSCNRLKIMTSGEMVLTETQYEDYLNCVILRAKGMPVAYIVGQKEFMGLMFSVGSGVLIPRGDTEIVVETALKECNNYDTRLKVLDIGCGSGAIGISIAYYCANADVTMVDISNEALRFADKNAAQIEVTERVRILKSDLASEVAGEKFHIVVSNPPYIESSYIDSLQKDVREYEPKLALDGGSDGLGFYRRITSEVKKGIFGGGMLIYEIGCGQAEAVRGIMRDAGFEGITVYKDLAGLDRCVAGRKING